MGAQYKVVDTHDGRVRKLPLTPAESQAVVESWYAPAKAPAEDLATDYRQLALESCANVQTLLGRYPALRPSFGNPVFEGNGVYTQDKVPLLGEALAHSSLQDGKKLVDRFIELVLLHWNYGISERVFNCTINNGVARDNTIVLLDFGEITTDKQQVARAIAAQTWLHSMSYTRDLPRQLKTYYQHSLADRLTLQTLEAHWGRH